MGDGFFPGVETGFLAYALGRVYLAFGAHGQLGFLRQRCSSDVDVSSENIKSPTKQDRPRRRLPAYHGPPRSWLHEYGGYRSVSIPLFFIHGMISPASKISAKTLGPTVSCCMHALKKESMKQCFVLKILNHLLELINNYIN